MTDKSRPPRIEDAPGLCWKPRKIGWEARWQARTDLVQRGYVPKSARLWRGDKLTAGDILFIQDRCQRLQREMLSWGQGEPQVPGVIFADNLKTLIGAYETDLDSPYRKLRYRTKGNYSSLMRRIQRDHGDVNLKDIKGRDLKRWHEDWIASGHVAMGHSLVGMLRTLCNFGATMLESEECERLALVLHRMRFSMPKGRNERLVAEQVIKIRELAHIMGLHSIALAQAIQFDCMLRQKDVIGEWVPISEPGVSEVTSGNAKWLRGVRWEEIDENLILSHVTSKRGKKVEPSLREAPMVLEEFALLGTLPKKGPMIIADTTGVPWTAHEFRRQWRRVATAAGVPETVRNMDSRAGAISEATEAGADFEKIRQAATHSNSATTQRYSRAERENTADVMRARSAHRKNVTRT